MFLLKKKVLKFAFIYGLLMSGNEGTTNDKIYKLTKDNFNQDVSKKPHFVMFASERYIRHIISNLK